MPLSPPIPSIEEIQLLRESTLEKLLQENILSTLDQRDITFFKTNDDYVKRFLMHHDSNQKLALNMAYNTLKWRTENKVLELTDDNVNQNLLSKKELFTHNRDIDGCKILIFAVRNHTKENGNFEEMKKFLIYWVERLSREENGKTITVFFDMQDAGLKNMDMSFIQFMINIFNWYYPFMLNYIIVLEMPWILNAMWKIIKGWLPPKALHIIKFVDKKGLLELVPEDQCLVSWGGTDKYEFTFEPEKKEKIQTALMNGDLESKKVRFDDASESASSQTDVATKQEQNSLHEYTKFHVDPSEELVFGSNRVGTTVTIAFSNNSPNKFAFKIKTTSPEKYRVRPSVGIIDANGRAEVTVTLIDQLAPSLLVRDKFLVIAVPTNKETVSQQEFSNILQESNKLDVFEVRLRVGLTNSDSIDSVKNSVPAPLPVNPIILSKLDQLMTRQTVMEEQLGTLRRLLYVIFFLMIGILFVFVITTNNLTSSLLAQSALSSQGRGRSEL